MMNDAYLVSTEVYQPNTKILWQTQNLITTVTEIIFNPSLLNENKYPQKT